LLELKVLVLVLTYISHVIHPSLISGNKSGDYDQIKVGRSRLPYQRNG